MQRGNISKPQLKTPNKKPLQAKLYFELPQPVTKSIATPSQIEIKPKVKPATSKTSVDLPSEKPPVKTMTKRPPEVKQMINISPTTESNLTAQKPVQALVPINSQFTGIAGKHVQQYNLQQEAKMMDEAGRYYQQQKNSPIIHTPNNNQFKSADEKLINNIKVRANCDGAARKTTAVILGFMGGMVDCTSKPDINSFIEKRINKHALLPAKHNKPLDKLPKSLVILD
ncbi:hypothetical protein L0668_15610 [Paraglaciecola aquimarina]|uniref:Uncharacterized protein n=1 Tax=Paraglaciecola algarum TaxID=3050085 RepID=A0ABS9DAY5_9ALTE|nr:hypothetical protein [Paraglaciecola sp. G1-23]MCF2949547.1 hypothetical protein [Paraglaciecola sp. G1-23]